MPSWAFLPRRYAAGIKCPTGHLLPGGSAAPRLCGLGTYFNETMAAGTSCPAGHWCIGGNKIVCEPGFWCQNGKRKPCDAARCCPEPAMQTAWECPPGVRCSASAIEGRCAANQISDGGTCTRCKDDTFPLGNACLDCPKSSSVSCLKERLPFDKAPSVHYAQWWQQQATRVGRHHSSRLRSHFTVRITSACIDVGQRQTR